MNLLYILLIFFSCQLFSDLEDQLKPIINKSTGHQIRNIDFIYMINLDQRPEKFQNSLCQLSPFGIAPHRFSAVNGWELTLAQINDVGLKFSPEMESGIMGTRYPIDGNFEPCHERIQKYGETYFCHCMARGTIGIALSHISILEDANKSGYETIWVMEDDIEVKKDPHLLSDLIDELDQLVGKENWDILFTDQDIRDCNGNYKPCFFSGLRPDFIKQSANNNYTLRKTVNSHFMQIGARSGAHSMIIRKSGIKKLLEFFYAHQLFFPYDMEYILPSGIQLYALIEDVVSNFPDALSDNGGPNYLNKRSL